MSDIDRYQAAPVLTDPGSDLEDVLGPDPPAPKFESWTLWFAAAALLICALALHYSYNATGSTAWEYEYDRGLTSWPTSLDAYRTIDIEKPGPTGELDQYKWTRILTPGPQRGVIVEFIRTLLVVIIAILIFGYYYTQETKEIINFRLFLRSTDQIKRVSARIMLVVAVCALIIMLQYMAILPPIIPGLRPAPEYLADLWDSHLQILQAQQHSMYAHLHALPFDVTDASSQEEYVLPYRYYSPYAIVNFVLLAIPLFCVGIYALFIDSKKLSELRKKAEQELFASKGVLSGPLGILSSLSDEYVSSLDRYSIVILGLWMVLLYEVSYGQHTLSPVALKLTTFSYGVVAVSLLVFWILYRQYDGLLRKVLRVYAKLRRDAADIRKEYDSIRVFKRAIAEGLYVKLFLLVAGIAPKIIELLLALWQRQLS